ncbi:efflux RND transporter periplasmic adaptor subunit [Planctomycetes bacterium CA13]
MKRFSTSLRCVLVATCCFPMMCAFAEELEGFTEPYRRVDVPANEIGVLSQVLVCEGDSVLASQLLARLDDSVLRASLEVARAAKDALGTRRGAEADVKMREKQLASYRELHERGNASVREFDRSESEYQKAIARLQAIDEDLEIRRLEYERAKAQVENRRIEAPVDGVVVEIVKDSGEFVSPTDPIVMQVVQLDQLKAVFSVPLAYCDYVKVGETIDMRIGRANRAIKGVVEYLSPVADAESASVRVKIRIANEQRTLQSGVAVRWVLNAPTVRLSETEPQNGTR